MHYATKTGAALAAALLLALPGVGRAQMYDATVSVQVQGGLGIPLDTFDDINDVGGDVGGTLVWHFHPNWGLRGDVDYIMLNEGETEGGLLVAPPVDMLYLGGGVEVNFSPPKYQDLPFTFGANIGAGAMAYDVDETFAALHPAGAIDATYLAFNGGGRVGYQITPTINLFVQAQGYLVVFDEADSQAYVAWTGSQGLTGLETFDVLWVMPVTGGIRLSF